MASPSIRPICLSLMSREYLRSSGFLLLCRRGEMGLPVDELMLLPEKASCFCCPDAGPWSLNPRPAKLKSWKIGPLPLSPRRTLTAHPVYMTDEGAHAASVRLWGGRIHNGRFYICAKKAGG